MNIILYNEKSCQIRNKINFKYAQELAILYLLGFCQTNIDRKRCSMCNTILLLYIFSILKKYLFNFVYMIN
jgi:hypothetical protein